MGFWDNLKDKTAQMNNSMKAGMSRFKNADFANASMAMCAMIAAADGKIDAAEKKKTAGFISTSEVLQVFDASDLKAKFDHWCGKLEADYDFGKVAAIQAIGKVKSKQDQARAVIQVGIIIGGADGNFDALEKAAVKEACHAVGISPTEFDL